MRRIHLLVFASSLTLGCAGSQTPVDAPDDIPPLPPVAEPVSLDVDRPPPGVLWRHEVVETVDAGLGYFLQRVSVEPALEQGRFTGFRIIELRPHNWWSGIDLHPGDVITRVNQLPIERETEAFKAFESLRTAPELKITMERQGAPHEVVFVIQDQPGHVTKPSPQKAKSAPAKDGGQGGPSQPEPKGGA